jgi:FKBP-type peptidyl-prolyl cis-trans isomerase
MSRVLLSKFLYLIVISFLLSNCKNALDDERFAAEDASIERYLKSKNLSFKKKDGIYYAIRSKGYGYHSAKNDSIMLWYVGYTFGSSGFVFDTNVLEVAQNYSLDTTVRNFNPLSVIAGSDGMIEGFRKGILLGREHELGTILFSSVYGFGDQMVGPIEPWTPLAYDILLISVNNYQIREEQRNISNFVAQHEGFVQDTIGFWRRFVNQTDQDVKPSIGDTIYGWYRASNLNGDVFAETANQGQQIVLDEDILTEGLTFGFMLLSPNETIELVVPSNIGYGVNGINGIDPYTPLFFEVRLDSIK